MLARPRGEMISARTASMMIYLLFICAQYNAYFAETFTYMCRQSMGVYSRDCARCMRVYANTELTRKSHGSPHMTASGSYKLG